MLIRVIIFNKNIEIGTGLINTFVVNYNLTL